STPVMFALLGPGRPDLTAAAEDVVRAAGGTVPVWPHWQRSQVADRPGTDKPGTDKPGAGYLRGLFVGGTLCDEAMLIAAENLGGVRSNIPLNPELALDDSLTAPAHLMIDFGDDSLTEGRAHPMIDPTLRLTHLAKAAADPETTVLLLDVVL